ncbi:hypothetical protein JCM10449v2_005310 [Rhodotorula kratochvilovae]
MAPLDEPSQAASSSPRQFTLVSSDGQSFPVDAIQLVAASKVFADMVHVGQPADQPATCTLAEDAETVALFVKTLETWESPSEQKEWLTLYKMADKYDCPERVTTDPFYAYAAGAYLKNERLMESAARQAIKVSVPDVTKPGRWLYFSLPRSARLQLDHFYLMLLHFARRSLDNIGPDEACPCSYEEDSFMHENSAAFDRD